MASKLEEFVGQPDLLQIQAGRGGNDVCLLFGQSKTGWIIRLTGWSSFRIFLRKLKGGLYHAGLQTRRPLGDAPYFWWLRPIQKWKNFKEFGRGCQENPGNCPPASEEPIPGGIM